MEGNGQRRPIVYLKMLGTVFNEKFIVVGVDYFTYPKKKLVLITSFFYPNNLDIKAD